MTTTPHTADRHVGPYRLLAKIGEGGMGVVHLARAPDGTRVALKVLRPHIVGDDEARARLSREVGSLRRVSSPRVAEVLDADPWGETPFVATRYVPGLSLHQHLREHGALDGADLRWFATCLAEAMAAVHSVGVLHRDIKPSNVLLEGRSPVLIDFGLARLAEDPRLTHTGWLLGTPGYLAPEILYGEDATTASDVHAWAATVVFAATGRPPFGTGPVMAIMDRVRRGEHDLTGVPPDLMPVVQAGLSPEPGKRPTTEQLLAPSGRVVAATAPSGGEDTLPWVLAAPPAGASARPPSTRAYTAMAAPVSTPVPPAGPPSAPPSQAEPVPGAAVESRPPLLPRSWQRASPTARLQRGLLLAGTLGLVAGGVAVAPYLGLLGLTTLVLLVRTGSWTAQAARERQHLRGRRRWYDAPLTALTAPWYLLVATGGTALLLTWATLLGAMTVLAATVAGLPRWSTLLVAGGVLALGTWWGPGAARVRLPARRAAAALTRDPWIGWTAVAALLVVLVPLLVAVLAPGASGQVVWDPAAGAPWREGTSLGRLLDRLPGLT